MRIKKKIKNKVNCSLFVLTLLSIVACHQLSDKKELTIEKQTEQPKFDVTRIVNKVLDSTDIAHLYGFDEDGTFAI